MTVSLRCDHAFFLEKLAIIKCCLWLPESVARHLLVHRKVRKGGLFKNCTVTLGPDGRWYFSLLFEYPKQEVPKKAAGKGPGGMESHRA